MILDRNEMLKYKAYYNAGALSMVHQILDKSYKDDNGIMVVKVSSVYDIYNKFTNELKEE